MRILFGVTCLLILVGINITAQVITTEVYQSPDEAYEAFLEGEIDWTQTLLDGLGVNGKKEVFRELAQYLLGSTQTSRILPKEYTSIRTHSLSISTSRGLYQMKY